MINDLEKQFFDIFGIEPMPYCCYHDCNCPINDVGKFNSKCPKQAVTKECDARIIQKPQITDRILLELICIIGSIYICTQDRETLKEHILIQCVNAQMHGKDIKHQVQALFKEVE